MQRSNAQPGPGTFEFHVKAFLIKILNRLKQREIKNTCHKDETVGVWVFGQDRGGEGVSGCIGFATPGPGACSLPQKPTDTPPTNTSPG